MDRIAPGGGRAAGNLSADETAARRNADPTRIISRPQVPKGQKPLVLGMARSGVAAARLLVRLGYRPLLADREPERARAEAGDAFPELESAEWISDAADRTDFDWLILSPGVPPVHPLIRSARARGAEIIGELELAYRHFKGRLVAVTGTNGKTTTSTLIGEILKNAGLRAKVVGNVGDPFSDFALCAEPEDVAVCEVSSFQLESVDLFRPSVALILNVTEDHLDRHGSFARYAELKARVFARQEAGDSLIVNLDDPVARSLAEGARAEAIGFSRRSAPPRGAYAAGGAIRHVGPDGDRAICDVAEVRIPGAHNLENALAAVACAAAMGIPPPVIRHTLKTFQGVAHRLEFVVEAKGVRMINDSKGTNADSTRVAVAAMDRPTVILLGGYDKKVDFRALCEAIAANPVIEGAVLIGACADQFERQLAEAGFLAYKRAPNFESAVREAHGMACEGGNVLLSPACASFDMFRDYEMRGAEFARIARRIAGGIA